RRRRPDDLERRRMAARPARGRTSRRGDVRAALGRGVVAEIPRRAGTGFARLKIAIDLGTTYSVVYVVGRGVVLREPSAIAVNKDSEKIIAFGDRARGML